MKLKLFTTGRIPAKAGYFRFLFAAFSLLLFSAWQNFLFAQAELVFGATATYMNISGGTLGTPIYLVVGNPANNGITGASATHGWIISEGQYNYVKWLNTTPVSYTIPFGYSNTDYLPFTFGKTVATSDLLASTWKTAAADNLPWANTTDVAAVTNMTNASFADASTEDVIDRWWTIFSAGATATLSFTYRGQENTMTIPTDALAIQHWDGTKWNDGNGGPNGTNVNTGIPGSAVAGAHTVGGGAATFTQFSPYVLVSQPHPLPVTWLGISAECNHGEMTIKWSTASEQNSNYFTVERSQDGTNFSAIATKTAAGSSNTVKYYSAVDADPYAGTSFYRVSETDFNGSVTYSTIISVSGCSNDDVTVYGSGEDVAININAIKDGQYTIELYDMLGQKIMNEIKNVTAGSNYMKLTPGTIASAIYVVKVYNSSSAVTKKVFIR